MRSCHDLSLKSAAGGGRNCNCRTSRAGPTKGAFGRNCLAGQNEALQTPARQKKPESFNRSGPRGHRGPGHFAPCARQRPARRCKYSWHLQRFPNSPRAAPSWPLSYRRCECRINFNFAKDSTAVSSAVSPPSAVPKIYNYLPPLRANNVLPILDRAEDFIQTFT